MFSLYWGCQQVVFPNLSQPFQPINPKDGVVGVALSEPLDAALRLSVVKMGPSLEATASCRGSWGVPVARKKPCNT